MARRKIVVSSAGGITAGAPFVVGQGLVVQQASPAVAMSARFGQVADAFLSFTAPGTSGLASSLVLGVGSDDRGRAKTIIYGPGIFSPSHATATENVLLGTGIDPGAAKQNFNNNTVVGGDLNLLQVDGGNVVIGWDSILGTAGNNSANCVVVGNSITLTGDGAVCVGGNSTVTQQGVTVGQGTANAFDQNVVVGQGGTANGSRATGIGQSVNVDANCTALGWDSDARGDRAIAIGYQATSNGFADSISLGSGSQAQSTGELAIGGELANFILQARIGPLYLSAYPGLVIQFTNSDFAGTNVIAPNATIRCGTSTGNAAGGDLIISTGVAGASGGTRQTLATALRLYGGTRNMALGGNGTFGGGALTLFLANAITVPTAAPTGGGLFYVTGGALHYVGTAGTDTTLAPA